MCWVAALQNAGPSLQAPRGPRRRRSTSVPRTRCSTCAAWGWRTPSSSASRRPPGRPATRCPGPGRTPCGTPAVPPGLPCEACHPMHCIAYEFGASHRCPRCTYLFCPLIPLDSGMVFGSSIGCLAASTLGLKFEELKEAVFRFVSENPGKRHPQCIAWRPVHRRPECRSLSQPSHLSGAQAKHWPYRLPPDVPRGRSAEAGRGLPHVNGAGQSLTSLFSLGSISVSRKSRAFLVPQVQAALFALLDSVAHTFTSNTFSFFMHLPQTGQRFPFPLS
jgi:hypothetical protein